MTPYDERTGWIELPKLLSSDEVEGVLRECDRLLTLPPEERARGDKPAAGTRHLMELDTRSPAIEAVATRLETLGPIVAILGDGYRRDQVSYRSPQPGFGAQRLHADDVPSAPDEPARVATAIIALRDFTAANGATRIVPGSHLRPFPDSAENWPTPFSAANRSLQNIL